MEAEPAMDVLLSLNGEVFPIGVDGHWTKFAAWEVEPSKFIPHGIKYSLTLHDKYNKRILGYDNAHAIKPKRKTHLAKKITWDHKHYFHHVEAYEFESAAKLLEDFWKEVDVILPP